MNKLKFILGGACLALGLSITTSSFAETKQPQTVAQVNLQRYLGTWYEIARLPMYFQNKCAKNVTANYSLRDDGAVKVLNSCQKADGSMMQAVGKAVVDKNSSSKLTVSFLPESINWLPVGKAGYWVLALDEQYQYALVGTPDRKYLWFLSRQKTMPNDVYQRYVNIAQQQGYNLSELKMTVQ